MSAKRTPEEIEQEINAKRARVHELYEELKESIASKKKDKTLQAKKDTLDALWNQIKNKWGLKLPGHHGYRTCEEKDGPEDVKYYNMLSAFRTQSELVERAIEFIPRLFEGAKCGRTPRQTAQLSYRPGDEEEKNADEVGAMFDVLESAVDDEDLRHSCKKLIDEVCDIVAKVFKRHINLYFYIDDECPETERQVLNRLAKQFQKTDDN